MIRLEVYAADGGYQIREIGTGLIEPIMTLDTLEQCERYLACKGEQRYVHDGRVFLIDEEIRQQHWNAGFRITRTTQGSHIHFQTRREAEYG